jgi:hypothetical protein
MKKLAAILVLCLFTPSCTFIRDNFCVGNDAVKGVTADALGFVPIVGPVAGQITNLAFDVLCTLVGLPATMGEEIESTTGMVLDPTTGGDDETADDPGS